MTNWGLLVGLIIGVQYAGYGYYYVYTHYIRPFLYYKITIFDVDDEYLKYIKKRECINTKQGKIFTLFKTKDDKGELYLIPLKSDKKTVYSKRDNLGHVTYYYYRNICNPISLSNITKNINKANKPISLINIKEPQIYENASMLYDLLESKIFNSSLMAEKKPVKINYILIGIFVFVVILIVVFKDQISALIGV